MPFQKRESLCALSRGLFLGYLSSKTATRAPFAPHIARAPAPPPPATRPGRAAQRLGVVGGVLAHSPDPPPTLRPPSYGQAEAASVERCVFDLRASCRENESDTTMLSTRFPGPHLEYNALATWRVKITAAGPAISHFATHPQQARSRRAAPEQVLRQSREGERPLLRTIGPRHPGRRRRRPNGRLGRFPPRLGYTLSRRSSGAPPHRAPPRSLCTAR